MGGGGVIQPLNPPNIHPVVKYSGKNERRAACWPSDVFRYVESEFTVTHNMKALVFTLLCLF